MSARIYVHPHTQSWLPAADKLAHLLTEHGYDMTKVQIYHHAGTKKSNVYELVRYVKPIEGGRIFQGMDGLQFEHYDHPAPRAA